MTMPKKRVRKAVFPAAGLGTRFLPATKAQPKEMLPLVDKPIIQYGVEEAVASGVSNIILVTGRGKNAIEDHFDVSVELETFLEARGKTRAARRDPEDLEPDQRVLRAPGGAARPRPRRAGHARPRRRRAVRGDARRRRDRRGPAGADADDRRVRRGARARCWRSRRSRARTSSSYGDHRRRGSPARRLPHPRHGREAAARRGAVEPRDHRPLHPDARHLPGARGDRAGQGSHRRNPADQRPAAAAASSGRSTAARSTASATTPATSSGS